jgi:hypothetical protein
MVDLLYFGDHCGPGIVIWDILNRKDKLLFMLGSFTFDKILLFLKDKNFDSIYDINYLFNSKNINIKPNFKSIINQNIHLNNPKYENSIFHSKYNFHFLHDYMYFAEENAVLNYDFIVNQYKLKIKNTMNIFNNNNPVLLLNFLFAEYCNNVIIDNIHDMLNVLNSYMPHKKYYLLFFTNFNIPNIHIENVFFIKINNDYSNWHILPNNLRGGLYSEIYNGFYDVTKKINLNNFFPKFEETYYYKNNMNNSDINTCGALD